MFVPRSTHDAVVIAFQTENGRLRQELDAARQDTRDALAALTAANQATEATREQLADVSRNLHTAILEASKQATSVVTSELEHVRLELARERAQRELLAGQLRIAQKDADWLRVLVNNANTERAAAFAQTGVSVPVPTIRPFEVPMRGADDRTSAGLSSGVAGGGLPGPLQEMLDQGLMEDIGDAAAAAAGIGHDEHGSIHFGPLSTQG